MAAQLLGYTLGGKLPEVLLALGWAGNNLEAYRTAMAMALGCNFFALIPLAGILRAPIPRVKRAFFGELREKDWRTLGKLLAPKALIAIGAGMIIPFMNVYLVKRFNLGSAAIGACFGVMQLCTFAGVVLGPLLVRRVERLRFIVTTALLSVPFMLAMAFSSSVVVVLGSFFLRNTLMNMSAPVSSLFEMERVREKDCLFASSMLIFCYNTAWTFSTQVGGWVIENHGFQTSFVGAAVFYVAAVGCYWHFFRMAPHKALPVPETRLAA
jgi:predicted MFS family arabinose efflux permease